MSAGWHLSVLAVLFWALRSRLPWTRAGGVVLAAGGLVAVALVSPRPGLRMRAADPDLWPAFGFVVLASCLAWWTMRREQLRTTPIHEAEEPESLTRWIPRSWPGLALVLVAAALLAAPLGVPPAREPDPWSRAPWYLLGLAEWARHLGPLVAWVVLPVSALAALLLTPWLDTGRPETDGPFRGRRDEAPFFLWAWLGLGVSPLAAVLFSWPTSWPATEANLPAERWTPLADWLWLEIVSRQLPEAWVLRELAGLTVLGLVAVGLPWWLPRWSATRGVFGRHLRRLGRLRYGLLCALLVSFMLVPLGLLMRVLGIGPWLRFGGGWWL